MCLTTAFAVFSWKIGIVVRESNDEIIVRIWGAEKDTDNDNQANL